MNAPIVRFAGRAFVPRQVARLLGAAALLAALGVGGAVAQLNANLREEVVMVPKPGLFTLGLETTVFKPPGDGPFPAVIINHGKASGDSRFQARARFQGPARELLARGYAVVLPMRQGFSKSGGAYVGGGCNVESNGRAQADDVQAVADWLRTQPWADAQRMLVFGQSHGGLTTLAFGTRNTPGVLGLVNFAGGLRQENCPGWEQTLARALGSYGAETRIPSLWFYGDNDSYWQPWLYREMHAKYVEAGGKARLVAFGEFAAGDAHGMFGAHRGLAIWLPEVGAFLGELGLPNKPIHDIRLASHEAPVPEATGFAPADDPDVLPHVRQGGRDGYRKYLEGQAPKAFAIGPTGAWAYITGRGNAMSAALERCNRHAAAQDCRLYAVDEQVVWVK
ncbi:MAG: prolyl oligopeptidase family serine peptidase [Betaproteobacteria bacterium]|nr:prolyl oligopeptidase family serine peptidase [Betaproteobacteria bacterium]